VSRILMAIEFLCLLGLAVAGLLLLPIVGWFCVWGREPRPSRGGYYDHTHG
jgi:amino acid transporter